MDKLEAEWGMARTASGTNMSSIQEEYGILMDRARVQVLKRLEPHCENYADVVGEWLGNNTTYGKFKTVPLVGRSIDNNVFASVEVVCTNPRDINLEKLVARLIFNSKTWYVDAVVAWQRDHEGPGPSGGSFQIPQADDAVFLAGDIIQELQDRKILT